MRPKTLLVLILITFLLPFQTWGEVLHTTPPLNPEEQKGVIGRDLILNREYDEALAYFKKLETEEPESLTGTVGQLAVWQVRMFENYDFRFENEFLEVSNLNKEKINKVLENSESTPWQLFLAGTSAGIRGFFLMRKGHPFQALGEAGLAEKTLKKVLQKDPSYADAYLGLGMYEYWRSVFTGRIKILPFFKDKRKEGIAQLEKAMREGRVAGALAQIATAFCFFEARNFNRGIPILKNLLQSYPESIVAKNLIAEFYAMKKNYHEAHVILEEVLAKHPEISVAEYLQGNVYLQEGNWTEAKARYEKHLQTNPPPEWTSYSLTQLAIIDLKEGKKAEAYEKFKKAYRTYPSNSYPLKELQKLRKKR
jgi:tetratricopeptide (TPR) repeat protein